MKSYTEPVFLISAVAEILCIHPQTLRQYEREGLIKPSRSNGKIRLYSQEDIDNIRTVLNLTRDFGVNLAGVEIIMQMQQKMRKMELELEAYKNKLREIDKFGVVPSSKALVIKKNLYDIVIFED